MKRVVVTETEIRVEGWPDERATSALCTCRTVVMEACGWAIARLGEEMQKCASFYRTGRPIDQIVDATGGPNLGLEGQLHPLWSACVGRPGYDKKAWESVQRQLLSLDQ